MIRFILRKIASKKWMMLALLIGNILLVSITCANTIYSQSVLQRTLTRKLEDHLTKENIYPCAVTVEVGSTATRNPLVYQTQAMIEGLPKAFGVPAQQIVQQYYIGPVAMKNQMNAENSMGTLIQLGYMHDMEAHVELVAGRLYAQTPDEDGIVDIMVSERGMVSLRLVLDEIISVPRVTDSNGEPLRLRVCGVFRSSSQDDPYWVRSPAFLKQECYMSETVFKQLFPQSYTNIKLSARFDVLMDYTAVQTEQVEHLLQTAEAYEAYFSELPGHDYEATFQTALTGFDGLSEKVETTLWVLQVPVFVLLAAFMFMVSQQMLEMERDEIAVLKSRGASKKQIVLTYFLQSIVMAVLGVIIGLPLGAFFVQVLGSANAFLEFVQRSALPIRFNGRVLCFACTAGALSVAAMVLPVFRYTDVTIVDYKQKKHRKSQTPMWQRLFLDVVILGIALYALYSYNGQKQILAQRVMDGEALDPLLYISSSLFMIGLALLTLRILPLITYGIFSLFKKWWSPALYTAFLQVIRTRRKQNFIIVFLILTIAIGVFNAQAARSINANEEQNIRYSLGADIVLQEQWEDNSLQAKENPELELVYEEPDFTKYENLQGVSSATKVLRIRNATTRVTGGVIKNLQVMGIHSKSFGETAWFRDGLLSHHFYSYLNVLAKNPGAVLLSRNFQSVYAYKLGDTILYATADGKSARGYVCGFVDYWPGYQPVVYSKGDDGVYQQTQQYLVVANLNQLQSDWGVLPYEVWLKAEDTTQFFYDYAQEQGLRFAHFEDASEQIVALKRDPVFQGTNGALTVGFVVVLLLCCVGFLIYWIVSIRTRQLQFGIYRAMGMTMREIISMLLCEHLFISATAMAAGVGVGLLTSKLFMPLIQMGYAAYDNVLPMQQISNAGDTVRLLCVALSVFLVCMLILGWLIAKMRVAQALKPGED